MNYHRKLWDKKKRNPVAKALREHTPKIIPNKKKLSRREIQELIDNYEEDPSNYD